MTPSNSYLFPRPVSRESFFGNDSFDRPLSRTSITFPAGSNHPIGQLNENNQVQFAHGVSSSMWPVASTPEPVVAHDPGAFSSQLFVDPFRRPSSGLNGGASTPINPPNSSFFPTIIPRLSVEFSDTIPQTRESAPPSPTNVTANTDAAATPPETKSEKHSPKQSDQSSRSQTKRASLPQSKAPVHSRNSKSKSTKSTNSPETRTPVAQPDSPVRGKSKAADASDDCDDDEDNDALVDEATDNDGEEDAAGESQDACESPMECGTVRKGVRILNEYVEFFGKEVELYTATADPKKRILVRASQLAELFNCATNKVGMYLARRRHMTDGLFQATCFKFKPQGRTGLKSGGYFLSLEVCEQFKQHYSKDAQGANSALSKDKHPPIKSTRVASRLTANQQLQQQQAAPQSTTTTTNNPTSAATSASDATARTSAATNSSKSTSSKSSSKPSSPTPLASSLPIEDKAKSKITSQATTSQSTTSKSTSPVARTSGQKRALSPNPAAEALTSVTLTEPPSKKPKGVSPPPSSSPTSASSEGKPKSNSNVKSVAKQSRPRSPAVTTTAEVENTIEDEKPAKKSKLNAKDHSDSKKGAKSPLPTEAIMSAEEEVIAPATIPVETPAASVIEDQLIESDIDAQRAKRKKAPRAEKHATAEAIATANSSRASTSIARSVSSISESHESHPVGTMQTTTSIHSTMHGVIDPRMPALSPVYMQAGHSLPASISSSSRSVNTEPSSQTMFVNHHASFISSTPASMNSTPASANYGRSVPFNSDFYQHTTTSTAEMFVQQQMVPYPRSQQDMSPSPIPPSHYSGSVNAEPDVVPPPSSMMGRSMNELNLSRDTIAALQLKVQRALESLQGKEPSMTQTQSIPPYSFSNVHMNFDPSHSKMSGSHLKQRLPVLSTYSSSDTNISAAASTYVDRSTASTPVMSRSAHNPSPASETNLILFTSPTVDEISMRLRRTASDSVSYQSNPMNAYHQHQQRNNAWMLQQKEGQLQHPMMPASHPHPHDPRFAASFPMPPAGPFPAPSHQDSRSVPTAHPQRTSPHPSTYGDAFPGFDTVMNSM